MNSLLTRSIYRPRPKRGLSNAGRVVLSAVVLTFATATISIASAQTGTLSAPFPTPAPNAALHYQQALLYLSNIPSEQRRLLEEPTWAAGMKDASQLRKLMLQSRYAVQSATTGTRLAECNFGIDFSEFGAGAQLPHVEGMVELGRLLALRASEAQSRDQWEVALIIYFDGLRMGRHLAHQNTLAETVAGIQILREHYDGLARWATRCPERLLVARAFGLFESIQSSLVDAPQSVAREASILALDFHRLREAYPDGNWAQQILQSYDLPITWDEEKDHKSAIDACVSRGVPKTTFDAEVSFQAYLDKIERTSNRFIESVAACMALSPKARVQRAAAIRKKYATVIPILSGDALIDPVEISIWFSQHDAELTLARIALAIAASRTDNKFPPDLKSIEARFGGLIPPDPYRQLSVQYTTRDNQSAFTLRIPRLGPLPSASFESQSPVPANTTTKAENPTPAQGSGLQRVTDQGGDGT